MGKVDRINENIRINEINRVSRINRINRVNRINRIKSSQQKNYYMCTFLGIISVVYIFSDSGENYLFFSCVLRKQKEKNKACVLTLYQDAQIYSSKKTPDV